MSGIIAKKYALALVAVSGKSELENILEYINGVEALFGDSKFIDILKSPIVSANDKVAIIIDSLPDAPEKFINFIKILAVSDRLIIIPLISKELIAIRSLENNKYIGSIKSDTNFSDNKIAELTSTLSKKLGVSLELNAKQEDYDGIKVEIPDMGLRIDFSQSHTKEQMLEHILKAI